MVAIISMSTQLKKRLQRLFVAVLVLTYVRKTGRSLAQHYTLLQLHDTRYTTAATIRQTLKYTFFAQFLAIAEYLFVFVKPKLATRMAKLLVWKPRSVLPNVTYGSHERQKMDLYGVNNNIKMKKPVLVFMHGGAWSFGHKWQYGIVGEFLAQHCGFLVAVLNYRTFPIGSVMEMVEDVEAAVGWVAKNCHLYGGDANNLFLSGHSSGAHVSALALTESAFRVTSKDPQVIKEKELATLVKGFIGLAGPYEIADHYVFESERIVGPLNGVHEVSSMKPAMLGMGNFKKRSPTALIEDAKDKAFTLPPFYLLHGVDDGVVPLSSSEKFAQNLKQAKQRVQYYGIEQCTHEDILFAVMGDNLPCTEEVVGLVKRIMQNDEQC